MVDRTSRLKLVIDAAGATASVERLNKALLSLANTARSVGTALSKLFAPIANLGRVAASAATGVSKLAATLGRGLSTAAKTAGSAIMNLAARLGGGFLSAIKSVAGFIKDTLVEALRNMARTAVRSMAAFAGSLVNVQVEMDKFLSIMTLSTKDGSDAVGVFEELNSIANTFGLTLEGNLMKEFTKFRTVMVQAGVSGKDFMEIFSNFAQVSNVFHLGTQDMQFAILALTQMVSKGKVSMEEMRRQLAERLPGVMQVAANAFNTTTRELELAITQGFVDPVILIKGMMEEFARVTAGASVKAVSSMEARLGRLANGFFEVKRALLDSGLADMFVNFFEQVQGLINHLLDSGAVEKVGKMFADMGNNMISFVTDTQGISKWWDHFANNWLKVMLGAAGEFGRYMSGLVKAIVQDLIAEVAQIDVQIKQRRSENPSGTVGAGEAFLDSAASVVDNLVGTGGPVVKMSDLIGVDKYDTESYLEVTMGDAANTAVDAFTGSFQAEWAKSAKLFSDIGQKGVDPLTVMESRLRTAAAIRTDATQATLKSQVAQLTDLLRAMETMSRTSDVSGTAGDRLSSLYQETYNNIERIQGLINPEDVKADRSLKDLMMGDDEDFITQLNDDLDGLASTLSSTLVNGAMEGKFAFKDMAQTIAASIAEVAAEIFIITPIIAALKAVMQDVSGGVGAFASFLTAGVTGIIGGGGGSTDFASGSAWDGSFAKGGMFSGPVTPFASGGVINRPTLFPMANGAGLMGEAGAEAIVPLKRGAGGSLGVGASPVNVTVNNMAPGVEVKTRQGEDGGLTLEVVMKQVGNAIARGGNPIANAMEGSYSLSRGRAVY